MFLKVVFADGTVGSYPVNYGSSVQVYEPADGVQASFTLAGVQSLELVFEPLAITDQSDYVAPTPTGVVGPDRAAVVPTVETPAVPASAGGNDGWAASGQLARVDELGVEPIPKFPPDPPTPADAVVATPAAVAAADEHGVDLATVDGSGVDGKVLVADVKDAAVADPPADGSARG